MSDFHVLVVDDSPVQRKLFEQALSQEPCSVHLATNGQEALEIFQREQPSLVITDCLMPDVTGVELCRQIREAQSSYTYIIMVTSIAEKDNIVKGLAAGADDYITKPFHPEELLARVQVGRRLVELQRELQAKNRLLEELALTDALTGLPNRRAIESWAEREISAAARHGFSFWVVLIDLDNFKRVNDTYGHDAGDVVLKRFSQILKEHTRSSDISGRIGGEEFLHIVTYADPRGVPVVAERIRARFAAEHFSFGGSDVTLTASFGAVGFRGGRAPAFSDLVSRADRALYRAKNQGRNRIEIEPLRQP
ncbi:MAG: diguanylate cyclase [Acidobacteriia bacterium]|nr:diguanylate cyclase [Terriglobia bacterium]